MYLFYYVIDTKQILHSSFQVVFEMQVSDFIVFKLGLETFDPALLERIGLYLGQGDNLAS